MIISKHLPYAGCKSEEDVTFTFKELTVEWESRYQEVRHRGAEKSPQVDLEGKVLKAALSLTS